jgi:hypothetical protein
MTSARKRPSLAVTLAGAALVAALAALVLSLTGVATGLPGKNRIDGNDLRRNVVGFRNMRNNAIGRAEMRNNAIGGPEVRPNSLRGADINESSLGQVPSAGNADSVDGKDAGDFVPADAVLFAYIEDTPLNPTGVAAIGYGHGAVSVDDPAGDNDTVDPYVVTFERDLSGCVANATSGRGDPPGTGTGAFVGPAFATVQGATVEVAALNSAGAATDTSFMLSVIC